MKPISSAITGPPSRAPQVGNLTGAGHGETGSVAISTGDPSREMHPLVMARLPSANTGAVLSKMSSLGVHCSVEMETVFPTSEHGETTFRQRPTALKVSIDSSADIAAALHVANESLLPASVDLVEAWLGELAVKTIRRKASDVGSEMALTVYTNHLRRYPADVTRYVLTSWSSKWWPAWGELAERLDEMTDQRLMIRDRLASIAAGIAPKPETVDSTAERLKLLRDQLEAAERVASKYPELAESSERKRAAIADEIHQLENGQG